MVMVTLEMDADIALEIYHAAKRFISAEALATIEDELAGEGVDVGRVPPLQPSEEKLGGRVDLGKAILWDKRKRA